MLKAHSLIDKVYNWKNLWTAWRKVRANKGAHGLDRVTIRAFEQDVETHLRELQRKLMEDRFEPHPVRRVYIPKASNPKQKRPLGIPVVIDRVCQQAIYQVLSPIFDPLFSDRSFGFRPGRKAHHAIATAIQDAKDGFRCVVDADISSFFDQIDHEVVISQVCTRIADGRVIRLLKAFLKAGISDRGVICVPTEGTPQGGVISPLLANIVLDSFDKVIEAKGWRHVRYADDFVILTKSAQEAALAMAYAKEALGNLNLSLHETKTRLTDFHEGFEFLGFHFRGFRLGIRARSLQSFKERVRSVTRRNQGRNVEAVLLDLNPVIRGYANYFGVAQVSKSFSNLDKWIRMRIRSFRLKRRTRHANHRLPTKKLENWGLLSLRICRPKLRLAYIRSSQALRAGLDPLL
jgi:RNA-directed DNA polymerase